MRPHTVTVPVASLAFLLEEPSLKLRRVLRSAFSTHWYRAGNLLRKPPVLLPYKTSAAKLSTDSRSLHFKNLRTAQHSSPEGSRAFMERASSLYHTICSVHICLTQILHMGCFSHNLDNAMEWKIPVVEERWMRNSNCNYSCHPPCSAIIKIKFI